jgi:glycosyltransferase involved in cell wall biosynthesis
MLFATVGGAAPGGGVDSRVALHSHKRLLIVLSSLCAEGTPVLTLDLCRRWQAMGIAPFVVTLAAQPDDLEPEFKAAGVPIHRLSLPAGGRGRFPALAYGIWRLCRELRPHAVMSMPLGWHVFTFLGGRAAGVRHTAAHVGNYPPIHLGADMAKFRLLVQLGSPVTDKLICCSSYIEAGVIEHFGVPRRKTTVIYNGVDVADVVERAERARRQRLPRQRFVVGMVARLEVHKDQPALIRAAATLKAAGVPVEIWLVGEGSRRAEFEQLIADLRLADTVKLLGMRRDVPELLGQMDAFVFSAKPDEGLGVALIEAMVARVPIIATDVGACREVLNDGALGTLVPAGDAPAIAAAIERLAREGAALARVLAARERAQTVFSIDEMAIRYARCLALV